MKVMGIIGIPFTEEMYGMIVREAKSKNIQPETLLKIWILERAKAESSKNNDHITNDPVVDIFSLPLKIGYILTASATATINTLVEELVR
ncbi:MAG: hypothetical protein HZA83_00535 [Thaumarchaeota archaeon]|nr:hypothetical protein [Nitrososphaerota archaeon]